MYESVTIKKQYDEYIVIKEGTLKSSSRVLKVSYLFMMAFALYLLLTVVSIFIGETPILVDMSLKLTRSHVEPKKPPTSGSFGSWVVRLFNVVSMLVYLSQMVFTLYHRGTLKVNTSMTIKSIATHHAIVFTIVSIAFFLINVIYFIMNVEGARSALILLVILLGIAISAQVILFVGFWWLANESLKQMMQFHEYLVNYRLTPRSRILRKHMPKLDAIIEQESAMESSSILHS